MADLNEFTVQGIVCEFDNAVVSGNLEDENKAWCRVKLNVQTSQKGEDGKFIRKTHEFSAFRKAAITLSKFAQPGAGLILKGTIEPSTKLIRNNQQVMTADGKPVYTGPQLVVSPFGIHPQRDYRKDKGNTASTAAGTNTVASSGIVDPMAMFENASAQQATPTAAPATASADGFIIGGSEGWPF